MAENKSKPSGRDVEDFLASVEPERRRADAFVLARLLASATGLEPHMWGDSIVGYGRYSYRYESGHSGEASLTGFSPRKAALTVYIVPGFDRYASELARLGPHRYSVSCLYLTRLDKIDLGVLETIVADSVGRMKEKYPDWSVA